MQLNLKRRGRDSNPRYRCQYDSLANCSFRPLRHLSYSQNIRFEVANIAIQLCFQKKITQFVNNLFEHDRYSLASS